MSRRKWFPASVGGTAHESWMDTRVASIALMDALPLATGVLEAVPANTL